MSLALLPPKYVCVCVYSRIYIWMLNTCVTTLKKRRKIPMMSYYMHAYGYELSYLPKWVGGLGGRAFPAPPSVNSTAVLN